MFMFCSSREIESTGPFGENAVIEHDYRRMETVPKDDKFRGEANRLRTAAKKAETKTSKAMLEGFRRFYDALADESGEVPLSKPRDESQPRK
jgi:hypothetical protein